MAELTQNVNPLTRGLAGQSDEAMKGENHRRLRELHRGTPHAADKCNLCGFSTLRCRSREARQLAGTGCRSGACRPPRNPCHADGIVELRCARAR